MAPVAAMAMAFTASGCSEIDVSINGTKGVPLAELDMSGDPPTGIVLAGADNVIVTDGDNLDIKVEGEEEAVKALRFSLKDGTLGIMRTKDGWKDGGKATIRVTMPPLTSITIAGSGLLETASLAKDANITIAGSGQTTTGKIAADTLEVTIAGTGTYDAYGTADTLNATIAGSGSAKLAGLKVGAAKLTIAGSGDPDFASDGDIDATILGSGNVTVTGSATCTVNSMGSGTVKCQTVRKNGDEAA